MWAGQAHLRGQTRRIKPRGTNGKSTLTKGGVAMGPALQGGSWEIKPATKYAKQSQGVQGVLWRLETGPCWA